MAKRRNRILDYLVYLLVRSIISLLQILPFSSACTLARLIARLAWRVDRRHRRVALENLRHAFGDQLSEPQRQRLVQAIYEHFARVIVEIAVIPRKLHVTNWKKFVTLENAPAALEQLLGDRATLIVTGHFGNWEMAGYLLAAIGIKSYAIARDLDNRFLHDFLLRFRQWSGQTILAKTGDFDRIQQVLSERKVLISVGDQSAGPRGYFIDFFGRPASTHKANGILAVKYNAPVLLGYAYRDAKKFHYRVGCSRVIDPAHYAEVANPALAMTADFSACLEAVIRRAPEQYLWLHNRWKHAPPEQRRSAA